MNKKFLSFKRGFFLIVFLSLIFGVNTGIVLAQATESMLYVVPITELVPKFPDVGPVPDFPAQEMASSFQAGTSSGVNITAWVISIGIIAVLGMFFFLIWKSNLRKTQKIILGVAFFAGMAGMASYFHFSSPPGTEKETGAPSDNLAGLLGWRFPTSEFPTAKFPEVGPSNNQIAYSSIRDPRSVSQGLPVRLIIPIINVDSAIEDAFITPDGRMDVPSGSKNVAWFALGPRPGNTGSSVIGGHFGIRDGTPFVFYDLNKLKIDDRIYIVDDEGVVRVFAVSLIKSFDRDADSTTVFTSHDGAAHLNLITCEGVWNKVDDTYPSRLVIFTDLVSITDTASIESFSPFYRSLSFGFRGPDVTTLQTMLEQKGFLTMPFGVAKGFFGVLTGAAVARYQTSVGLPSVGLVGPLTRAKLGSEMGK